MDNRLAKALVVEFIGTFALIFVGAGSGIMAGAAFGFGNLVTVALAHGLVIFVMVMAYGHISGTNINPAVTIGLWLAGKMDAMKSILYIVAQLLGAIIAAFLLRALFGSMTLPEGIDSSAALTLGATTLNTTLGVTAITGLILETIATFFLVNTVLNTAVAGKGGNVAGLAIGMTLTFMILFIGPLTGASLNPARTLGPAIALGARYPWNEVWVYLVGPILGALIAAALYRWFLETPEETVAPAAKPVAKQQPNRKH